MSASSQNPGPTPPAVMPIRQLVEAERAVFATFGLAVPAPAGSASPDVPAHLVVQEEEPSPPACFTCRADLFVSDLWPDPGGRRYPSGGQVFYCGHHVPDQAPADEEPVPETSVEEAAAAMVLDAVRAQNADATSQELAAAEAQAGILFDAAHVQEAVTAAVAQAETVALAEISNLHIQLALMAGAHRRVQAVLRLCEGRRGDDLLLVAEVAVAAECGTTALDGLPMVLTWTGRARVPDAHSTRSQVVAECTSAYGGRADVAFVGDDRRRFGDLLEAEARDSHAKCPTRGCGDYSDLDPADPELLGWAHVQVAGTGDGPRWYCSAACVAAAMDRAAQDLAHLDEAMPGDPDETIPDTLGPAEQLDADHGAGASDEYALQLAEAHEADVEYERGDVDEADGGGL